ncbi:MAG: aspartate aminotransferase family protein [Actinomycetota bacterium]
MSAASIDRTRLRTLHQREEQRFVAEHPSSAALAKRANGSLVGGVPMTWMMAWPGGFPLFMDHARGARITDVDGHEYVDLCLGDTGAMTGHVPAASTAAITEQLGRGITTMLPTEDAVWVGEELTRRFGLPLWQFCLTASDANRFTIRLCREITERPRILVFDHCYHGSVDETVASLEDGRVVARHGNVGPPVPLEETTRVVAFNDLDALERELAHGDVACVLTEPALTNIGIVLPDAGFHDALRSITRQNGALLVVDETHTISTGPGGYTAAHGLEPDVLTIGKPIGSGVPAGTFGITEEVRDRMFARTDADYIDVGGFGGTLAGNALSLAAIRATLEHVLTDDAFARMIPLAERWERGVRDVIDSHGLPWDVQRLGARSEYWFAPNPPRDGAEAASFDDPDLSAFTHLYALNRGILLTPFHNMALMSPMTTEADVDLHTEVFGEMAAELIA